MLFIAGCEENQGRFHPQFDYIVLLSAPLETLIERLATRTTNSYGKAPRSYVDSSKMSRPLNRCCAGWPVTKFEQQCR